MTGLCNFTDCPRIVGDSCLEFATEVTHDRLIEVERCSNMKLLINSLMYVKEYVHDNYLSVWTELAVSVRLPGAGVLAGAGVERPPPPHLPPKPRRPVGDPCGGKYCVGGNLGRKGEFVLLIKLVRVVNS